MKRQIQGGKGRYYKNTNAATTQNKKLRKLQ